MIASYLGARVGKAEGQADKFARTFNTQLNKAQDLRYAGKSAPVAAFYVDPAAKEASVATAKQLQGKELSYNNIADTDAALECVKSFAKPALCDRETREPMWCCSIFRRHQSCL